MKRFLLCAALLALTALPALAELDVIATNFPLYDFASHVAGDAAQVRMLIRPGVEVHAYDPTPRDMIAVERCDLLLYVGGESEKWVDALMDAVDAPPALRLMDCVEGALEEEHDHDGHEHGQIEYDEHIWTSPVNAMRMVQAIADGMAAADPANAELYARNASEYIRQIGGVDSALRETVAGAKRRLVVFADRFPMRYFAREYGLEALAAFPGCSGESEPSAKVLRQLIDAVRDQGLPCVYTIELSTGRVADTVREETGCGVQRMHSCQNVSKDEMAAGETYVSLMWKNVEALRRGLY